LLGVLPGVRQDLPGYMTGWILKGAVRLIERGAAAPSGQNMGEYPVRRGSFLQTEEYLKCSPDAGQSSESAVRPESRLYFLAMVQFGQASSDPRIQK
jgi:hypothetical protein